MLARGFQARSAQINTKTKRHICIHISRTECEGPMRASLPAGFQVRGGADAREPQAKTGGEILRASCVTGTSVKNFAFLLGYWGVRLVLAYLFPPPPRGGANSVFLNLEVRYGRTRLAADLVLCGTDRWVPGLPVPKGMPWPVSL